MLMKNCNSLATQMTRRSQLIACASALAVAFTGWLPQPALAEDVTPPAVPADIQVPPGNKAFLEGHGVGTQDYVCLPSGSGFAWILFTPQASLFGGDDRQVTTHFFSPNPFKKGAILATWQHSRDTSTVWAQMIHRPSSDPRFVARDAIPWLLLQKVDVRDGPTGGDTLAATTFIQRVNTSGGIAPSTGCSQSAQVGTKAFVPYSADYFFYSKGGDE
jgi:hypothetical protein